MEKWKDILEVDGLYQISNTGQIRSKDRYARVCGNGKRLIKGRIIKPVRCVNGYLEAQINYKGKRYIWLLHRLVAEYFIPNPNSYTQINHKDENITNNCADNLEWCTPKYNANYGTRNIRCSEKVIKKPVIQLSLDGLIINTFESVQEAMRKTKVDESQIIRVCKGRNKTAGGYKWQYASVEVI